MNQPLTPQKATSLGVLVIALWMIVLGIYNVPDLVGEFRLLSQLDVTVTYVPIVLIVLWKMLPLVIGIILFRNQRFLVHQFYSFSMPDDEERNSWHDTGLVATFVIGLLGLFLLSLAVERFCAERLILMLILEIDNPKMSVMLGRSSGERLSAFAAILYPFVFGTVFVGGAGQIGKFIGRKIDQSLEKPLQEEDDSL